jgi:hypothetical protein
VRHNLRLLLAGKDVAIRSQYSPRAPQPQDTLDIFKGQWSSRLPASLESCTAGEQPLFCDPRLIWGGEQLGSFQDKAVLEIGPLEGGHSWMMANLGAASVTAVEASSHAFLRCLLLKELLGLERVRFLYGDCVQYLKGSERRFDVIVASGVLYHMRNPVQLLELISRATDRLYLWTHYYEREVCGPPRWWSRFSESARHEQGGFAHTLYHHRYHATRRQQGFCGGSAPYSEWLDREDLFGALRHFGFTDIRTAFEEPYVASVALVARR